VREVTDAAAVVVAAGWGRRLGEANDAGPKALIEVAGRTLLELAVGALAAVPAIGTLVVVHPPGVATDFADRLGPGVRLVPGGQTRTDSVRAGVQAVDRASVVAIHDAARPLVPPVVIERVLAAVGGDVVAAAPALPVADTLKHVEADGPAEGGRTVVDTIDRSGLWAVQTPQVIRRELLLRALEGAEDGTTDDLGLVEQFLASGAAEGRIVVVPGDPRGMKVTYPADIAMLEALVLADPRWSG
jgi:2-C-methyl-D-erythritol 4-phosphate cytidylyltransferase